MNSQDEARTKHRSPSWIAASALVFACILYLAWIGAWLLERSLESHVVWMNTSGDRSAYWLIMKMLLWILPATVVIRLSGRRLTDVMGFERVRSIIVWGGGVGLILGATTLVTKTFGHHPLFASQLGWPLFSGVLAAPIVEEIAFRGAILGALGERFRFGVANAITGLLFTGVHFIGWYFQGRLLANLKSPIGGALSIFLLGLVFGYVAHRSKSVAASTLTHILNNLFNA
ncbi:MAG: CPBP family intramembrane metalloprotease [Candidatus Hydrogenedentes bacterium]|nr:CPBP family intramembrane metalloprotease [Candidatus Hydrogenedentota bacterium]